VYLSIPWSCCWNFLRKSSTFKNPEHLFSACVYKQLRPPARRLDYHSLWYVAINTSESRRNWKIRLQRKSKKKGFDMPKHVILDLLSVVRYCNRWSHASAKVTQSCSFRKSYSWRFIDRVFAIDCCLWFWEIY